MGNKSRTTYIIKNAAWTYAGKILFAVLGLVNRTIIIRYLGVAYLGINGLYANILGILSLTEFGLSYAINYCLYKPIANDDHSKIRAYVHYFKRLYRIIIVIIISVGSLIAPFLKYIIKEQGSISTKELYIYYFIFLFNTAISYISAHSSSVSFAQQKGYQIANIQSITNVMLVGMQTISLIIFRDYLIYLLINSFFIFVSGLYINFYVRKQNPYLKSKDWKPLEREEVISVRKQIRALIVSKIGEVCVTSSDNLIISALNGLDAVGMVSNYVVVIDIISGLTTSIINAFIPSFGNAIAIESKERVKSLFKLYNFLTNWIYSVSTICLFSMLSPLIRVWVGNKYSLSYYVVACLVLNFYMYGMRMPPGNVANAAGLFAPNKYVALIQGIVNLIVSIILGRIIGVLGVFIGTIVSGLVPSICRPVIVYKHYFKEKPFEYFKEYFCNLLLVIATSVAFHTIITWIGFPDNWIIFILLALVVFILSNILLILLFHKRYEYVEIKSRLITLLRIKLRRDNS